MENCVKTLQIGDTFGLVELKELSVTVREVIDVTPIKFNGIKEIYEVCKPSEASYNLLRVRSNRTNNDIDYLLFPIGECKNLYVIADLL